MLRVFVYLATFLVAVEAQNTSFPLESVTLTGTVLPRQSVLEISELRLGTPIDKSAIEAACARLNDSGLSASIGYRYAPSPNHGYTLTLTLADQTPLVDAAIDVPGVNEDLVWRWLTARYPPFDHKVPGDDAAQRFLAKTLQEHLQASLDGQPIVARMDSDLTPRPRSIVSFQPETLPQIASIAFIGEHAMTSVELTKLISGPLEGQGFTPCGFRQALELNIRPAYEDRGMYRVRFLSVTAQRTSPSAVAVTTTIDEGPTFTLGDVQLIGENLPAETMLSTAKGLFNNNLYNITDERSR